MGYHRRYTEEYSSKKCLGYFFFLLPVNSFFLLFLRRTLKDEGSGGAKIIIKKNLRETESDWGQNIQGHFKQNKQKKIFSDFIDGRDGDHMIRIFCFCLCNRFPR